MVLSVTTNISSINSQRNLQRSTNQLSKSLERLSSGLRINRAGDDAAGLAISEGLQSQIRGLNQAVRNAGDGLSLIGTAESTINTYTESLQRIRELAIQAANDTNSASNRQALNLEAQQLLDEMQRLASTVEFNGTKLLDGSFNNKQLQIGAQSGQTLSISTGNLQTSEIGQVAQTTSTAVTLGSAINDGDLALNGIDITDLSDYADDVSDSNNARSAIAIAAAINAKTADHNVKATVEPAVVSAGNAVGAATFDPASVQLTINGVDIFDTTVTTLSNDSSGTLTEAINAKRNETGVTAAIDTSGKLVLTAADGRNIDVSTTGSIGDELGLEASDGDHSSSTGGKVTLQSNSDILVSGNSVALFGLSAGTIGRDPNMAINNLSISSVEGANLAIQQIDNALEQVNDMRSGLGALTNRLDQTIESLQSVAENLSASNMRIQDADFAEETASLTKNQILQQAGISILGQANQTTQAALQLLQG